MNTRGLQRTTLHHGDCRKVLASLPDASVDSVVTDPPYGISFMGKEWDSPTPSTPSNVCVECGDDEPAEGAPFCLECLEAGATFTGSNAANGGRPVVLGQVSKNWHDKGTHSRGYADNDPSAFQLWCQEWATEVLRVLKPGGYLLAFGGTRTHHRMACAIEDAGFEIRDSIHWLYGSGFPKSLNVSKAIDKAAGAKREVIGTASNFGASKAKDGKNAFGDYAGQFEITAPATADAARWEGWGTALKPAHEPVVVARKPLAGTVAANVLEHGTGALNIDGCRVAGADTTTRHNSASSSFMTGTIGSVQPLVEPYVTGSTLGRWPANVVLDPDAAAVLDGQAATEDPSRFFTVAGFTDDDLTSFRYVAKPDKAERNVGLDGLPVQRANGNKWTDTDYRVARGERPPTAETGPRQNFHPTVKPLDLMRWLVRLVTPPGGTVLDPFAGSGTTLAAGLLEGFTVVGIELTDDYLPIIEGRCQWAERESRFGPVVGPTKVGKDSGASTLFDEVEQ